MAKTRENLGRAPGTFLKLKQDAKAAVVRKVLDNIGEGLMLNSACWAAEVDPADFAIEMDARPHLRASVYGRFAKLEKKYIQEVNKGDKSFPAAKAALEMLTRGFDAWRKRDNASLAKSLEDALIELKQQLDPDTYELVVRVLERHS